MKTTLIDILKIALALVVGIGINAYFLGKPRATRARWDADAQAVTNAPRPPQSPQQVLRFFLWLIGCLALVSFVYVQVTRYWDRRHPAVEEHRRELIAAAVYWTDCPAESVEIVVEEPTRAQTQGCGKTLTFRWGTERGKRIGLHWFRIDPNCTFRDLLGFTRSCE